MITTGNRVRDPVLQHLIDNAISLPRQRERRSAVYGIVEYFEKQLKEDRQGGLGTASTTSKADAHRETT